MKKIFDILVLAILLCLLHACATANRDKVAEEAVEAENLPVADELKAQFTSAQLTAKRLEAFEWRAMQKLKDLADYFNLIADSTLSTVFREQALGQSLALFADKNTAVAIHTEQEMIEDLLRHISNEYPKRKFTMENIKLATPLQATSGQTYHGSLSFTMVISSGQESADDAIRTAKQADILVKKVEKAFGDEKELIWEVFLGEIR